MITITISGPRQSGKSTIAVLLKEMLAGLGCEADFVCHSVDMKRRHLKWDTVAAKKIAIDQMVQPVEIRFVDDPETIA